jgi:hypothetical protein
VVLGVLVGFVVSGKASEIVFSVASENLCSDCSVNVKSTIDSVRFPPVSDENLKRVAIGISNIYRNMENTAIKRIEPDVARTSIGQRLLAKSEQSQAVNYRFFYQTGIDARGFTSHQAETNELAYEIDKRDPHELSAFFRIGESDATIFFNEYQRPRFAAFTLVHELTHLFDDKTRAYLDEQSRAGEWTELDQMAIEFRAYLAEVIHYTQLEKVKRASRATQIVEAKTHHGDLLNWRGNVSVEKVAEATINLFYPRTPSELPVMTFEKDPVAYDLFSLGGNPVIQPWKLGDQVVRPWVSESISGFVGEALKRCGSRQCPAFSVALLNYRNVPAETLREFSNEGRTKLEQFIRARGVKSSRSGAGLFLDYLSQRGLLSDVDEGLKLRDTGLNQNYPASGAPGPRLGGGTFRTLGPTAE